MFFLRQTSLKGIIPLFVLIPALLAATPSGLQAQQGPGPAAVDPADIFFQAWLEIKRAEKFEQEGKFNDSWQKYKQAAQYYDALNEFHQEWKPNLVKSRMTSTEESMQRIQAKAAEELAGNRLKTQDLIEAPAKGNIPQAASASGYGISPPSRNPASDPATVKRLKTLEQENTALKKQLDQANKDAAESKSLKADLSLKDQERKRLTDLIAKKDQEIAMVRDVLARAPLQQDMDDISHKNQTLEKEIEITARALKSSEQKLEEAQRSAANFQEEAQLAKDRAEKIERDMLAQKDVNNEVIRGLREELKTVTGLLEQTRKELGMANNRISKMQKSLDQSQATIQELTKQRDELRVERDTLASILKKNDSKGIQELITENVRLGSELKEALERLDFLEKNHNATKDELSKARADLAIAKNRILKYQEEQKTKNKTIESLESQLRQAQSALTTAEAENGQFSNKEEITTLRSTVQRLLQAQERRRLGMEILWDTYRKSKVKIEGLGEAIEDIRDLDISLTDQEKEYVTAQRAPDSEFRNPDRVSQEHAERYGQALAEEISYTQGLIFRHFRTGRIQAAHSVLMDINERAPGNYRILCSLGVVEMKLGNYLDAIQCLDEAITMRENSSYAHFMLGVAQYKNNDLDFAQSSFERSLDIKPENARAHLYLGNLAGAAKRYEEAEKHFTSTIKLDPTLPDAYYNLSVLCLQQKRKEDAMSYYQKALNNGAQPDQLLEKQLN